MSTFRAFRIHERDRKIVAGFESMSIDDLSPGDVVIRVSHSDINYKDALAATGAGRILRKYPLNGGIDLAGTVHSSTDSAFAVDQPVLVTGCGLSETIDGGYAEFARVAAASVIPLPPGIDAARAMALGTAGFTAALAIHRMEHNGLTPAKGKVIVTGATGGVGSLAVDMLAARGYTVVALTGKSSQVDYLQQIGASEVLLRESTEFGTKPLEAARFIGAIDNVGGDTLAWLTRVIDFNGSIASIGLASSPDLKTTVMPFILRGVNILGINSSQTPGDLRRKVWERISSDLAPRHLDRIVTRTISFDELPGAFDAYIKGRVVGRTVVRIAS